jgi:hypothetical protein
MSDYHYPGARAQHQRNAPQRSQPVPSTSYSASVLPTTPEQARAASYAPEHHGAAGYTPEQLHAAGYTPEQLHAAGYSVAPNVMAPAALLYAPAVMQLHALNRLQESASNPYQQAPVPAYQQAPYPAYQQYPHAPAHQAFAHPGQTPVDPQSLLASLSQGQGQGQGLRLSQAEEARQKWIGLSPESGSKPAAITASQQSLLGLSSGSRAIQSRGLGPRRLKQPSRKLPVAAQDADPSEEGLPPPHFSFTSTSAAGSPSLEEQLQAEFEYTRLPSVPRRKDYAEMDAERPKLMGVSKIFVRSKVRTQKGLDRRERKNASARANAATKRTLVEGLSERERSKMTKEEIDLMEKTETARERKNRRSHESHTEKKNEIDRILSRTPEQRTPIEVKFLEQELSAKRRKNEGDRLRRLRLKEMGFAPSRNTGKIGIPARGPIPAAKHPGASGASVSTATSTASATAAPAAARSDEYSIATGQSPTNEGTLLTYGYQ